MAPMFAVSFSRPWIIGLLIFGVILGGLAADSGHPHAGGILFAAFGVAILWFGLIPALRVRVLLKDGVQAQGTVVGAERQRIQTLATHHPRVQFTTADGRTVEFTSAVGFAHEPDHGGAVPVRYRRDDPEQAEIERATSWMLEAALGLLAGLGLLVIGVVVYVS